VETTEIRWWIWSGALKLNPKAGANNHDGIEVVAVPPHALNQI
jgi:hypothetical protein